MTLIPIFCIYKGPALCLYFAALRSSTNPPSVPLPRGTSKGPHEPTDLSYENCPPAFVSFLRVWASTVPSIQRLPPEHQHDLARIICGLEPLSTPIQPSVNGIAADLRAVAIEISQRRSFQDRFASDLQVALDAGVAPGSSVAKKASFVPPPMYEATHRSSSLHSPPLSPSRLSPKSQRFSAVSNSPSILVPNSPAIEFIRETLYASIADCLERQPSLRSLLKRDPPRAYFASVAFAILDVATNAITPDGAVVGVLGQPLTLEDCPPPLRPFMIELAGIGQRAKEIEEADNESAMKHAEKGEDIPPSRMDRVKMMLEEGVGHTRGRRDAEEGRRSVEGRAVAFMNRINALSLGMTSLRAFKERQEDVFKVLAGVGVR